MDICRINISAIHGRSAAKDRNRKNGVDKLRCGDYNDIRLAEANHIFAD